MRLIENNETSKERPSLLFMQGIDSLLKQERRKISKSLVNRKKLLGIITQ